MSDGPSQKGHWLTLSEGKGNSWDVVAAIAFPKQVEILFGEIGVPLEEELREGDHEIGDLGRAVNKKGRGKREASPGRLVNVNNRCRLGPREGVG